MKTFATLALGLTIMLAGTAQADKIYRWVDDNGVPQYTAHPPIGRESTLIRARTGHSEPVGQNTPTAERADPVTPQVEAVESVRDQERCAAARQNLEALRSMARIRVMGDDGESRFLSDDERQQRALENQKVIDESC